MVHLENLQRYYEIMACPMGAMFIERKSNGPLNHKIEGNTMYYMISCKFSEFPFELCRKRAFNRAKKALFWSRAKILPSGYHAQLDSCAGPFLGVVQNFWRYIHLWAVDQVVQPGPGGKVKECS